MRGRAAQDDLIEEVVTLPAAELRVLRPRDSDELLDEEAFEDEEFLPYWAELWPSGVALARAVSPRALRGARTLELGCGLGLPSIAAALAGGGGLAPPLLPYAVGVSEGEPGGRGAAPRAPPRGR